MSKRAASLLAILTLAITIAGLKWEWRSFSQNILAELAGVLLSVLIAVLIVDRLIRSERRREWRSARANVRESISFIAEDFAYETYSYLMTLPHGVIDLYGQPHLVAGPFSGTSAISKLIEENIGYLSCGERERPTYQIERGLRAHYQVHFEHGRETIRVPNKSTMLQLEKEAEDAIFGMHTSQALYITLEPTLRRLESNIVPRALQVLDDPALTEKLMSVERFWREWRWEMTLSFHDWESGGDPWESFAQVARAIDDLNAYSQKVSS